MPTIRRRLTFILAFCMTLSVLFSALFVNLAVNSTFTKYISDNQNNRNQRIVRYFEEVYKRDLKWTKDSGKEEQHEGYMSNYCLTLLDQNQNVIWAMDPSEIKNMNNQDAGSEYRTTTFNIQYKNKIVGYVMIGQYQPVLLSEQDVNFKNSINRNIAISVLLTIAVSFLISMFFSKQFSTPIKAVSETSVDLSEGKYKSKAQIKSRVQEINNLIKSINILGDRLRYQDDLRKRLVSDISHEIRTPLNIFQNNLEAMVDGVFPATKERLNNLNDEVIRFGKLLNNLDILKEFEEESISINYKNLDVAELVKSVYENFKIQTYNKNIQMSIHITSNVSYSLAGDKDKLRQVFINILSNAVKFTRENGSISIDLKGDKNHIFVIVKDTGIGIKKEDLPFIFERLYRGDKSRHEIEGSGIGLTVTKQILIHHSALIDIESEEGRGTCVTVRFNK